MNQMTRQDESSRKATPLYLSFDLGSSEWKLAFGTEAGERPRLRTIAAGNLAGLLREIERSKERFGLSATAPVVSCYEAGRDGFWLHRFLHSEGIKNVVVDSSSIEVNRRARRAKTDRLDAQKLLSQLIRFDQGEKKVFSVLRVPGVDQEDQRQGPRELGSLKQERTSHRNRIKSLLASQGLRMEIHKDFLEQLEQVRLWDGSAIPAELKQRLQREYERLSLVQKQIQDLERQRRQDLRQCPESHAQVSQLLQLRGIGENSAWLLVLELFGWRQFQNGRELGALSGLTPMPHQSGATDRDPGISKAGNRRVRSMLIEIAWAWIRLQPRSRLTLWFEQRYGPGNRRSRRVGIVAVARRLLIALWRYLRDGVVPDGADLKAVKA